MTPTTFPGALYALTPEPDQPPTGAEVRARFISVHSDGQRFIAIFTGEEEARQWVRDNTPTNSVLRPYRLADKTTILSFLRDIASNGETHVCIDPGPRVGGFVRIADLIARVGGIA